MAARDAVQPTPFIGGAARSETRFGTSLSASVFDSTESSATAAVQAEIYWKRRDAEVPKMRPVAGLRTERGVNRRDGSGNELTPWSADASVESFQAWFRDEFLCSVLTNPEAKSRFQECDRVVRVFP